MNFGDVLEENVLQKIELGNGVWTHPDVNIHKNGVDISSEGYLKSYIDESFSSSLFWDDNPKDYFWGKNGADAFWNVSYANAYVSITFTAKLSGYLWVESDYKNAIFDLQIENNDNYRSMNLQSKTFVNAGENLILSINS